MHIFDYICIFIHCSAFDVMLLAVIIPIVIIFLNTKYLQATISIHVCCIMYVTMCIYLLYGKGQIDILSFKEMQDV